MRVGLGLLAVGLGVTTTTTAMAVRSGAVAALGGKPDPDRLRTSPRYRNGAFRNPQSAHRLSRGSTVDLLRDTVAGRSARRPVGRIPLVAPETAPARGVHLTWYGHASSLVQLDDTRVLFDPVFSDRASPFRLVGPKRLHPVPHRLDELPRLDAVVLSHDHYDHLDMTTVRELARSSEAVFVVPLGVGAHLRAWGVPGERVTELDWGHGVRVGGAWLTATPARHFSGRALARNTTLWSSWVVANARHRVFYSGDTGYIDGFADIGREHGPFDATLIQVGAYAARWPDIHMTPEQGVATHRDVRGGLLVPVHWGTFNLAPHGWAEPVERVLRAADEHGVAVAVPRPGERVDVAAPPPVRAWWRPHSPEAAPVPALSAEG